MSKKMSHKLQLYETLVHYKEKQLGLMKQHTLGGNCAFGG